MSLTERFWQLDNFSKSSPLLSLPKHLHDCYFFYYSRCNKNNYCEYRHENAALGHEMVCSAYLDGNCWNPTCPLRHMIIDKKRSCIFCYWEDKPGGCKKEHCVFKHRQQKSMKFLEHFATPTSITANSIEEMLIK